MMNTIWHQVNKLTEKYEVQEDDKVAFEFVNILKGRWDTLGVDEPADLLSYIVMKNMESQIWLILKSLLRTTVPHFLRRDEEENKEEN